MKHVDNKDPKVWALLTLVRETADCEAGAFVPSCLGISAVTVPSRDPLNSAEGEHSASSLPDARNGGAEDLHQMMGMAEEWRRERWGCSSPTQSEDPHPRGAGGRGMARAAGASPALLPRTCLGPVFKEELHGTWGGVGGWGMTTCPPA